MTDRDELYERVRVRIERAAREAFDPATAQDSDGLDQAQREGLMQALEIVAEELRKAVGRPLPPRAQAEPPGDAGGR